MGRQQGGLRGGNDHKTGFEEGRRSGRREGGSEGEEMKKKEGGGEGLIHTRLILWIVSRGTY